jgi:polysaccharide biosynthesis/export protein
VHRDLRERVRWLALSALVLTLAACGLPRSGPTMNEIFAGSVMREGDAFIVSVNDRVTRATAVTPALGFPPAFLGAGQVGADTISPGDTLTLTIYENVSEGLLVGQGQTRAVIEEVQVGSDGFIFVPYAGRIRAAGSTPDQLRTAITRQLDEQTPDPQVTVSRAPGNGSTVTVAGRVGAQGVYPIERPTRTLTAMLARAGGVQIEPTQALVSVLRSGQRQSVWLQDLYRNPALDIALRNGDRIVVEQDTRSYTILGATGAQNRITFTTQSISAIEALAQVGGLNSNLADPRGIFVFRNEPADIANVVLGRTDLVGAQRIAYVLDLTQPMGMFLARDFAVRDGDTIYVTEAPFVQWQKTIAALTGSLTSANAISDLAN